MFKYASFALALLQLCSLALCQSMGFDAREATIDTVQHDLFSGLTTCRTVVSSFLSRIELLNGQINAIITLNPTSLEIADELDRSLAAGNATGLLFCIPVLLKDNYDTSDMNTTAGNLDLAGSQPSVDAPAVVALRDAGAIILGKTNLHELALEGISVSSLGGQTINPYDKTRTPGGSSGGSGAAMAASLAVFATGSDTVNSLRSPASANSLFSVRPTRGLIGRTGIVPISYTQDVIGPITRTVKDAAVALTVMASTGYDPEDNTTALVPADIRGIDYSASLASGTLRGVRLGLLNGFFNRTAANETTPVNDVMDTMIQRLQVAGAIVVPINSSIYNATAILNTLDVQRYEYREGMDSYLSRPSLKGIHPTTLNELYNSSNFLVIPAQYEYVTTSLVSSTSNSTYDTVQYGIQNLTLALQKTFTANDLDAIIYPEQRNLVVKLGSPSQSGRNGILAALTGSPVVTVPAGFSPKTEDAPIGVPIGMEILGRMWTEETLLQIAWQIERLTKVRRMPELGQEAVEVRDYREVPTIRPDRGNIPAQYPIGVL
ncbi:hypothetical protein MMC24_000614 [Lignoscripta atroalba]|nr:hypothetical protein [Lignoscripta atroalba]